MAIDNISFLKPSLADAFCRLCTGGAFVTRKLFTDNKEMIFNLCRPVLFNGIQEFCMRGDFVDRSLQITLKRIPEDKRRTKQELTEKLNKSKSKIFGAILDALSATLRELPNVELKSYPRMADFAHFSSGIERALNWPQGVVMLSYDKMRVSSNESIVESCLYAGLIISLAEQNWAGTATALLQKIESGNYPEWGSRSRIPINASALSGELKRLAPAFRSVNINIYHGQTPGSNSSKYISIRQINPNILPKVLNETFNFKDNGEVSPW